MLADTLHTDSGKVAAYFSAALVAFILSFILWDSAKFTNNLFYALIALPGLFFLVKSRAPGMFSGSLGWTWLVFILWFLVPAFYSGDFQFYKHVAYVGLFVFVVAGLTNIEFFNSSRFIRAQFWIICLYIFASSIHSWMTGQFVFGQRVAILVGRLDNVIYASIWLVCALGRAMPVWSRERRWVETGCAMVLTLIAVALVMQTRTGLVGAVFLAGLWALNIVYRYRARGALALLALVLVTSLSLWLCRHEPWVQLLFARGDSYRVELFEIMTGEWRNCGWLLGCGVEFVTTKTLTGGVPIQHPHNIFVAMGLYTGAISLVLFIAVMALTLWHAVRLRDGWGWYLAAALVMLNFDGSKLVGNPDELWLLVLLPAVLIYGRVVRERRLELQQ